ncbi:hypothetical protein RFI_37721, partial [Reticulomyxa filosa]
YYYLIGVLELDMPKLWKKANITNCITIVCWQVIGTNYCNGLKYKMRHEFGLKGRMHWWLDSFLYDRFGQVVLNGMNLSIKRFDTACGHPNGNCYWHLTKQSIIFKKKNKRKYPKMYSKLNNNQIKEDHVKYLGLIVDSQLTYRQHINYIYGNASRKLGYLTYLCSYKGIRPSLSVYNLLYKTIIRPSLEYACAFLNGAADCHKRRLERIQRISMCRILG